tara:strand:- start:53 stop:727 length:675 start_codon:yes stop_codon:yes gene_type:complete
MNANYQTDVTYTYTSGTDIVTIGYAQVLKSYRKIADENEYSSGNKLIRWGPSRINRMLKALEDDGRVKVLSKSQLGSLILIENYQVYQEVSTYKTRRSGTPKENQEKTVGTKYNNEEQVKTLWQVYLDELGGEGKKPTLTAKRKQVLSLLYDEQLKEEDNYTEVFRGILKAVKSSDYHMGERAYQMPESLFRNDTRRSTWAMKGSEKRHQPQAHGVGREWSIDL